MRRQLLAHQRRAIEHVEMIAIQRRAHAKGTIRRVIEGAGLAEATHASSLERMRKEAQVALHFHPDRVTGTGHTVAEGLLSDGVYRNQFETGISSGSPTAFPGGDRDVWEKRLFGGAYHGPGASTASRPKYGALSVVNHPDGPSPRFGSCYLMLSSGTSYRSTFTFGGTNEDRAAERTGNLKVFEPVIAALLSDLEEGHGSLGIDDLTVRGFLRRISETSTETNAEVNDRSLGRALDSFVEAQVHGVIDLGADVERLVADPSFQGSPMEELLTQICSKYNILLEWHPGFALHTREVPRFFRGYPTRMLAQRVASDGVLTAAAIGAAANSFLAVPESWRELGSTDDGLTCFRRLWHVMVKYGVPLAAVHPNRFYP